MDALTACTRLSLGITIAWLPQVAMSQAIPIDQQSWSAEVIRPQGQPVIPLFDGWFPNDDGSSTICFGYFNLNTEQSLDIPAGELNHLSDENYETLLPTHFEPLPPRYRRRFCVFTVQVPADFGRDQTIEWTLTSNGQTLSVPGHTLPAYVLDEPASDGRGDIAPLVRLTPAGEGARGRVGLQSPETVMAQVGDPVNFKVWIEHPDPRVWVGWAKHSGPGEVVFDFPEAQVNVRGGPAGVVAYFEKPGDYVVRMQTIDDTDAFEFYCCHTNTFFRVQVASQSPD